MCDPIRTIGRVNVGHLAWELAEHPELWNRHASRTSSPESPHHGLDDIWARYAPPGVDASGPHDAAWYASVTDALPSLKGIVYDLAHAQRADRIGGVLITRIPPGRMCRPHRDGGWHAGFYRKFGVQIASAPGQAFCFEGVRHETRIGDVFAFDNAQLHWVENQSSTSRITMIVCLRLEESCPGV